MTMIDAITAKLFSIEPATKRAVSEKWEKLTDSQRLNLLEFLKELEISETNLLSFCAKRDQRFPEKLKAIQKRSERELIETLEADSTTEDRGEISRLINQI